MMFNDFYDWLSYLVKISNQTNYDWYIKPHPDLLPGTLEHLQEIVLDKSCIKLVSADVSFHQLKSEGLDTALTCFGSIGHELPLLGINVVNAAYNPHISFDFNYHPKSIKEYEKLLFKLPELKKKNANDDIYKFYYMNFKHTNVDDLIYKSYKKMTNDLSVKEQFNINAYNYFVTETNPQKSKEIKIKINDFIDSGKTHFFSDGPENFD